MCIRDRHLLPALAGADANCLLHRQDEDLAVADLTFSSAQRFSVLVETPERREASASEIRSSAIAHSEANQHSRLLGCAVDGPAPVGWNVLYFFCGGARGRTRPVFKKVKWNPTGTGPSRQ